MIELSEAFIGNSEAIHLWGKIVATSETFFFILTSDKLTAPHSHCFLGILSSGDSVPPSPVFGTHPEFDSELVEKEILKLNSEFSSQNGVKFIHFINHLTV